MRCSASQATLLAPVLLSIGRSTDAQQTYIIENLGALPGYASTVGVAINDSGQVVEYGYDDPATGPFRAVIWDDRSITELGALGGSDSKPYAINNSGQIVGWATNAADSRRPCLWDNGGPADS